MKLLVLLIFSISTMVVAESSQPQSIRKIDPASYSFRSPSDIANYKLFNNVLVLTDEHQKLLRKNLFFGAPRGDEQPYWVFGTNDYQNIPSLVTTDCILHLYHVFFDSTLRMTEEKKFYPALVKLTQGMLARSVNTWRSVSDPLLKRAALKNVAYFGVAARALSINGPIPSDAVAMVNREMSLISSHSGPVVGAIFPYKLDYSQFTIRGHYSKSQKLQRYFRAMMWYGLAPFALEERGAVPVHRYDEQIRQGILLVRVLYEGELADWQRIYEPTCLYVGSSNNLTPTEWKAAMDRCFGANASISKYALKPKFEAFVAEVRNLRESRIQANTKGRSQADAVQLRFMGQRYTPDSEMLQRLTDIKRLMPSGLDVMAVLGSDRAKSILDSSRTRYNPMGWVGYEPERAALTAEFSRVPASTWNGNLYFSWIYSLKALLDVPDPRHPSFMKNSSWRDKSLNTALASWTELRHDTILYGTQSVAEAGDGDEPPPFVPGYVEPNVVFYDRLIALTIQSRQGLSSRKLMPDANVDEQFKHFENLLMFLRRCSVYELSNRPLSKSDHLRIRKIEGELSDLTETMLLKAGNFKALTQDDLDMAQVADVHTGGTQALEEAVGHANQLIAIVPIEGKLYLARGPIFTYYEFVRPVSDRMTDEAWKKMLSQHRVPPMPHWTSSFFTDKAPQENR